MEDFYLHVQDFTTHCVVCINLVCTHSLPQFFYFWYYSLQCHGAVLWRPPLEQGYTGDNVGGLLEAKPRPVVNFLRFCRASPPQESMLLPCTTLYLDKPPSQSHNQCQSQSQVETPPLSFCEHNTTQPQCKFAHSNSGQTILTT